MNNKDRSINYLNKDFNEFKQSLTNYAKTYFPNDYNDFSESSPGNMFMEMVSYVGDVLSFYTDNQIQENFIQYARQSNSIYDLAYLLGYKPKLTSLSILEVDFYQLVPAMVNPITGNREPNMDYALSILPYTIIEGVNGESFINEETIDFSVDNSISPLERFVHQEDGSGNPIYFLLKKSGIFKSGNIETKTVYFGDYSEYPTFNIVDNNFSHIIDAYDEFNNRWYEVDYLGQDTIYEDIPNSNIQDLEQTPKILTTKRVHRKFVTKVISPDTVQIQFGSGSSDENTSDIIPDFSNVGIGLNNSEDKLKTAFSPNNFIFTSSYGIAPKNHSITFRYISGGGISSNIPSKYISKIVNPSNIIFNNNNVLDSGIKDYIIEQFSMNNPFPSKGGGDGDTLQNIKINSSSNFSSQNRSVTADDYIIRSLSLPSKYGLIFKAFAKKPNTTESNHTLDLYTLSRDRNGHLTPINESLANNLKTYLIQNRMIGDSINIKNAYIINIGVNFEIIIKPGFMGNDVLMNCINTIKNYFNINKWHINQPILLKPLYLLLDNIPGVHTVKNIKINNISSFDGRYSMFSYDIESATREDIIYPSLDPSIFELKYIDDIKGKTTSI